MSYTVTYKPSAEDELMDIWLNASDRQEVTNISNHIDFLLATNPHSQGESRTGSIRILFATPLAVQFEILDDDRIVEVLRVWWIGK